MQRWNSLLPASRAAKFCGGETEVSSSKLCFSQEGRGSVTKTFMSRHFIFKPIWRVWQRQWISGVLVFPLTSWENQTDSMLVNENKMTREATPISKVTIDEWRYRRLSCPLVLWYHNQRGCKVSGSVKFSGCDSYCNQTAITHTTTFSSVTISSLNKYWYWFKFVFWRVWLSLTWYEPKQRRTVIPPDTGADHLHPHQTAAIWTFQVWRQGNKGRTNALAEILRFLRSELQAVKTEMINRTEHGEEGLSPL